MGKNMSLPPPNTDPTSGQLGWDVGPCGAQFDITTQG